MDWSSALDEPIDDLIRLHGPRLQSLARHLIGPGDVDEVLQRTWVAAWRAKPKQPKAWLDRVLRRTATRVREEGAAVREREKEMLRPEAQADASAPLVQGETLMALSTALAALPQSLTQVVLLRYVSGLSVREVAQRLDIPQNTVRTRARSGKQRLREELERRSPDWRPALALAGTLSMTKKVLLVALVVTLLSPVLLLSRRSGLPPVFEPAEPGDLNLAQVEQQKLDQDPDLGPGPNRVLVPAAPTSSPQAPPTDSQGSTTEPTDPELGRILGIVRYPDGPGVPAATVRFGSEETQTAADGSFALTISYVTEETPLVAYKSGHQPAVLHGHGPPARQGSKIEPVELILRPGAGELRGRLLAEDGSACANWELTLYDAAPVAPANGENFPVEDLAGGRSNLQRTGPDGSFHLVGLRKDRSYRLRAWNEASLQSFVSEPRQADAPPFTWTIARDAITPRLHGAVLDPMGQPLEGVRVRMTMYVDERVVNGQTVHNQMQSHGSLYTDAQGRFSLVNVPAEGVFLRFHGQDVGSQPYWLGTSDHRDGLIVRLPQQGSFRIAEELLGQLGPDALEVWDAQGHLIAVKQSGAYPSPGRVELPAGESPRYRCGNHARWLVLYKAGREVERLQLSIQPGKTITVPN